MISYLQQNQANYFQARAAEKEQQRLQQVQERVNNPSLLVRPARLERPQIVLRAFQR